MKEVKTKRALQKEQTSKAILGASLTVFANLGYNTATFSDVSKIAKVTNGLIVQRFGSKEALYLQLLNEVVADFPKFEDCNDINDVLTQIVKFIKTLNSKSIEQLSFFKTALETFDELPESVKDVLKNLFVRYS